MVLVAVSLLHQRRVEKAEKPTIDPLCRARRLSQFCASSLLRRYRLTLDVRHVGARGNLSSDRLSVHRLAHSLGRSRRRTAAIGTNCSVDSRLPNAREITRSSRVGKTRSARRQLSHRGALRPDRRAARRRRCRIEGATWGSACLP